MFFVANFELNISEDDLQYFLSQNGYETKISMKINEKNELAAFFEVDNEELALEIVNKMDYKELNMKILRFSYKTYSSEDISWDKSENFEIFNKNITEENISEEKIPEENKDSADNKDKTKRKIFAYTIEGGIKKQIIITDLDHDCENIPKDSDIQENEIIGEHKHYLMVPCHHSVEPSPGKMPSSILMRMKWYFLGISLGSLIIFAILFFKLRKKAH